PRRRVVQLRGVRNAAQTKVDEATGDQDLAVGQQGCRMQLAGSVEVAGATPCACGRVVQLRAVECVIAVDTSGDQDLAALKQGCGVTISAYVEIAGADPYPSGRIVKLGTVEFTAIEEASRDQNL